MKKSTLAPTLFGLIAMAGLSLAKGGTENFDSTAAGNLPTDWIAGDTGFGSPKWAVSADPSALSKPNVLLQFGSGRYPWAVSKRIRMTDGFVETRFKAISGKTDSAAGVVWRWADGVWSKEDSVKRSIILRGASVSLRPERDRIAPRYCPN